MFGFEHNASRFHYFNELPEQVTTKEARASAPIYPPSQAPFTGSHSLVVALRRAFSFSPTLPTRARPPACALARVLCLLVRSGSLSASSSPAMTNSVERLTHDHHAIVFVSSHTTGVYLSSAPRGGGSVLAAAGARAGAGGAGEGGTPSRRPRMSPSRSTVPAEAGAAAASTLAEHQLPLALPPS